MSDETRSIEKSVTINAPADAVWRALSDARELERWFPLRADVTPGVGGRIWVSWGQGSEGASTIAVWEPNRRLGTVDTFPGADGAPVRVAVDYYIESQQGGTTVVRLVHSGFSADAAWDEMYDAMDNGWAYFLFNLRHYLERHPGKPRTMVWERRPLSRPRADVWEELTRALGEPPSLPFLPGPAPVEVLLSRPPNHLSALLPSIDDGLLLMELEQGGDRWHLGLWISTYGIAAERTEAMQHALGPWLDGVVGPPAA